ncbi:MAG: hypothetical protein KDC54_00400 [Lewinella sp.]|nr:hypothetical protein [Lewinella sp.]
MFLLLLIGLLLAGVVAYLLWAPMVIEINTRRRWYGVHYGPVLDAQLVMERLADPSLLVRFWRWHWRWSLWNKRAPTPASKAADSAPTAKSKYPFLRVFGRKRTRASRRRRLSLPKILKLLRTFRVRQFQCALDTDDYVLNAYLFPIGTYLTAHGWPVAINFQRQNELDLKLENRMSRLIRALFF